MDGPVAKCDICGCDQTINMFKTRTDGWRGCTGGPLVKCANCGLVYVWPRMYESKIGNSEVCALWLEDEQAHRVYWKSRLRDLHRFAHPPGRLLDVGCYMGFFLDIASEAGWEVFGAEPDVAAVEYCQRKLGLVNVTAGTLNSIRYPDDYFDVVTLYHVIEHLPSPSKTQSEIQRILKPGGLCVVEAPDCGFWMWVLRSHFRYFQPDHWFYFTPHTLRLLLARTGFKIIQTKHVGKVARLMRIAQWVGLYSSAAESALTRLLLTFQLQDKLLYLDVGDIMITYSRKRRVALSEYRRGEHPEGGNRDVDVFPDPMSHWYLRSKLAYRLSRKSRHEKLERLYRVIGDNPATRIIDIGAGGEWEHSENALEKNYPYPERIVAVSLEEGIRRLKQKYSAVRWVLGNGLGLPFPDKAFDVACSNAVIEHVIGDQSRRQLVAEMLRVARCCFITTPNALFPVEVHSRLPVVHWLPDKWHNWVTKRLGMGHVSKGPGGYFDPITPSQLRSYFPTGLQVQVHVGWLGMTLIAICDQGE